MNVGEIMPADRDIELNAGRAVKTITVSNLADRPIQVGSHFHFFEANRYLQFDRREAYGYRLNIPSGTAIRFEPGETYQISLVELGGRRRVFGLQGLTCGEASPDTLRRALARAAEMGLGKEADE